MSLNSDKLNKINSHTSTEIMPLLDSEKSQEIFFEINEKMKNLRRDFKKRERGSHVAAAKIVLTS